MFVDERRWPAVDCRSRVIDLKVALAEVGVVLVLVPPDPNVATCFTPLDDVVFVPH
jgi:hypothetical protein